MNIIKERLEKEWPGESIFSYDSRGTLNNDGKRSVELWCRRKSDLYSEFKCIACNTDHSDKKCPECGTINMY